MKMRRRLGYSLLQEEDNGDDINLTPLIDMVFILLIFFLVTTSFIRASAIQVDRPQAATALAQTKADLIVTVSADQTIWLNDAQLGVGQLRVRLQEMGISGPTRSVIILADKQTNTGLLIKIMDQLRLAGFVNIAVAARQAVGG